MHVINITLVTSYTYRNANTSDSNHEDINIMTILIIERFGIILHCVDGACGWAADLEVQVEATGEVQSEELQLREAGQLGLPRGGGVREGC